MKEQAFQQTAGFRGDGGKGGGTACAGVVLVLAIAITAQVALIPDERRAPGSKNFNQVAPTRV